MKTPAKLLLLSIMTAAAISCTGGKQFTPTGNGWEQNGSTAAS
ncbi:hypothetical protein [Bacteroides caecigallinarum]|nr:hypothetical protein [Bacteroides caecigallinarum]